MALLKLDGTMVLVGALTALDPLMGFNVIAGRKSIAGSGIGGMVETQEMIDFCAAHEIVGDVLCSEFPSGALEPTNRSVGVRPPEMAVPLISFDHSQTCCPKDRSGASRQICRFRKCETVRPDRESACPKRQPRFTMELFKISMWS